MMKKQTKTGCLFCDGVVDEFYDPRYWISHAECYKCGTTWEKMYDEYDLINMRITQGYGYVCYVMDDGSAERRVFKTLPSKKEIKRLLIEMNEHEDSISLTESYIIYQEDSIVWVKQYGNQEVELIV